MNREMTIEQMVAEGAKSLLPPEEANRQRVVRIAIKNAEHERDMRALGLDPDGNPLPAADTTGHRDGRGTAPPTGDTEPTGSALQISKESWEEANIPGRPWLVPGYLLRGTVGLMSGAAGASKSSVALMWATSLALGVTFGRFHAAQSAKVVIMNAEDSLDEQRRRVSAGLRQFGRTPEALQDRLVIVGPKHSGTLFG